MQPPERNAWASRSKDEWKQVLKALQEAGKLTYDAANDSISLPA